MSAALAEPKTSPRNNGYQTIANNIANKKYHIKNGVAMTNEQKRASRLALKQMFRDDLEAAYNMADHPKAAEAFNLAYDHASDIGHSEVHELYIRTLNLIR